MPITSIITPNIPNRVVFIKSFDGVRKCIRIDNIPPNVKIVGTVFALKLKLAWGMLNFYASLIKSIC